MTEEAIAVSVRLREWSGSLRAQSYRAKAQSEPSCAMFAPETAAGMAAKKWEMTTRLLCSFGAALAKPAARREAGGWFQGGPRLAQSAWLMTPRGHRFPDASFL